MKQKVNESRIREIFSEGLADYGTKRFPHTYLYTLMRSASDSSEVDELLKKAMPISAAAERAKLLAPLARLERSTAKTFALYPFSGRVFVTLGVAAMAGLGLNPPSQEIGAVATGLAAIEGLILITRHMPSVYTARKRLYSKVRETCIERRAPGVFA